MHKILTLIAAMILLPFTSFAQDGRATLERAAAALGGATLTSIEYTATGNMFDVGQSAVPGQRGPQFILKNYVRSINYETGSLRTDLERARAEARGGGAPAPRQIGVVSGDLAWNVVGDAANPAPVALATRQFDLWSTPHGIIKAAMRYNAAVDRPRVTRYSWAPSRNSSSTSTGVRPLAPRRRIESLSPRTACTP